jgi:hypothetical protein
MAKLFRNYEECLSIIITIIKDFEKSQQYRIGLAINVCDSLTEDKDKIFRLYTPFRELLWEIPEAVSLGFHQYMEKKVPEIREILGYHNENCKNPLNCKICIDRKTVLDNMYGAIYYERKESRIHA